jgi:hypothetical protein
LRIMLSRLINRNGARCGRILIKSNAVSTSMGGRSIISLTLRDDAINDTVFGSGEGCANSRRRLTIKLRRSRGIPRNRSDEDNDANENGNSASSFMDHAGSMSSERFHSIASELLDRVESAVAKLKDCNRGLEIERYPAGSSGGDNDDDSTMIKHGGRLSIRVLPSEDLFWGGGTYCLTIIPDDHDGGVGNARGEGVVTFQTPLSGSFVYIYNASTKEWVGSEDGHSLLGMLTRDWIRQCNGVPDL